MTGPELVPNNYKLQHALGVAIIGCGYWGSNYVRVFSELPGARVVAVCEQRTERLLELAPRFPGVYLTTSFEDAIRHEGVDAVVICTEASSHYALVRRAMLAGRHVLVEKPITTASVQARELAELADATGKVLMVGHTFIYNSGIRKVKELVDQGHHRVYYLYACRTNLGPVRRDVNALWDLATHDIAIFNYLLESTPEWVSAIGAKVLRNCREDVCFLSLGYKRGVVGHIHVSWADPNKARELAVVCSDRRIVFNDLNGLEQVRIYEKGIGPMAGEPLSFGEYALQIRDGDIIIPKIEIREPLKEQCRHFVECVRQGGRPLTSAWEALQVLRVLEAAECSMKSKGAQIEVAGEESYATSENAA
jgi:predicted dehydrogenase